MPALFFSNLGMLAGLAALAIPIAIHLLLRRRKKRLRFSTVQFFLRQDEQSAQRRKLRNWLLLTLRLLICALLVLAFARPYLQGGGAGAVNARKRQVVLVLDRSLSMQAEAVDGPKWLRAREAARQIVSELNPDDQVAIVGCSSSAEVLSGWAPPIAVTRILNELHPASGAASISEGLQQARRLIAAAEPGTAAQIYLVSDLQQSSCQGLSASPLPQEITIKTLKIGDLVTPNLAVTDLQIDAPEGAAPRLSLSSFSDEPGAPADVEVLVDGKVTSQFRLAVAPGTSTNLDLTVPPLAPGWHDVQVRLRQHDALPMDNARFQSIFVPDPARVFVVEPRREKRVFEQESFFISAALDPGKGTTNPVVSPFTYEQVSADELVTRLRGPKGGRPCDVIILPGLRQLPGSLPSALLAYLQAGGGLLIFAGEAVNPHLYNAELRGILPAPLGATETAAETTFDWRIGAFLTNTAMFGSFNLPNSGDLSLVRFFKRFTLLSSDTNGVLARYDDQAPLVLSKQVGPGRVLFINSSADTSWNDWPKHKTFVPWLHGTAQHLSPVKRMDAEKSASLPTEAAPELHLGIAGGRFKLVQPDGKELEWNADENGLLEGVTLARPGVYSLRDAAGVELRRLAVNVPAKESDLSSFGAAEFETRLVRAPERRSATLAGLFGSGSNQRELWRVLLAATVALLFIEMLVANRTLA